ncbi:uncharacterized protein B0I36DRAFT_290600 [Microdochium trichocladiopsis]|uniref:DNA (cytosine-5-)-methyltransferase n=1 Tax=Microdochium trichocladiopsis TaxID=1682393 RepID=A0A9P9BM18_9PEZI|nr:uncharacterized protein B0I36DRAFT_290600 [Microdochium trichocladiopsis]KAH7029168.1 hypothetical protein B0I36DRAFT_290600 [Microdochium trichocladiopsis]
MASSVISISSDSDDEDVPAYLAALASNVQLPTVRLGDSSDDASDDVAMEWGSSPRTDSGFETDSSLRLPFRAVPKDTSKKPPLVCLDDSDGKGQNDMLMDEPIVRDLGQTIFDDTKALSETDTGGSVRPQDHHTALSSSSSHSGAVSVHLPISTLVNPRSSFDGFVPPAQEIFETRFLQVLERDGTQESTSDYIEVDLDNFAVYVDSVRYPHELRPLQALATMLGNTILYFDGEVHVGAQHFFLKRVPFRALPIGGYDNDTETVRHQIWIHSMLNERRNKQIFYRLRAPAIEYERFYTPFLWIADLAKHFISFCDSYHSIGKRVMLADMKHQFQAYIIAKHGGSTLVDAWLAANRSPDFRSVIIANAEYIWKEANGVSAHPSRHTIWKEIKTFDQYRPNLNVSPHSLTRAGITIAKTSVTPYIYGLFEHFDFSPFLEAIPLSPTVQTAQSHQSSLNSRHTIPISLTRSARCSTECDRTDFLRSIEPGDVISTHMDNPENTATAWTLEPSIHHEDDHVWMARVQKVHIHPATAARLFDVLWLYHPRDTSCGRMKYPWKKEMFLSDNCTCHSRSTRLSEADIIAVHEVEWFGDESSTAEFFIRQIYLPAQNRWERLQTRHFDCSVREATLDDLQIGETVLGPSVGPNRGAHRLQPLVIEDLEVDDHGKQWATVRILARRLERRDHGPFPARQSSALNELFWTSESTKMRTGRFQRRCFVRIVEENEELPTPYDRNGAGDLFFIRQTEENASQLGSLRQAFDPAQNPRETLRGLDLFCGGGNFGRGLEEGGAIRMRYANDISSKAIHTYMANNDSTCQPFLGSVDDLLHSIAQGLDGVPKPGDVDFISGGSPCPGFSRLTIDKTTARQQKNRSLSASFASFVDCLRPSFGVLENVKGIVEAKDRRDSCVLSQLICAFVGLGYQTQLMWLDAWSFGAPQSRERVFLCFAAPGCVLPRMPEPSHSHPPGTKMVSLGKMSNGLPYGQREDVKTPFEFLSASAATADLPSVYDGKADYCIGFPDHRLSVGYTALLRKQLSAVPTRPYGLNFRKIAYSTDGGEPILRKSQLHLFGPQRLTPSGTKRERASATSKGWGRVHPHGLFSTVTTACQPADARAGTWSHWDQNRPITVLEARRAQGFLDHEVLLGGPPEQWKVVGNSVSRHVALALGLVFREAWFGTLYDEQPSRNMASLQEETMQM